MWSSRSNPASPYHRAAAVITHVGCPGDRLDFRSGYVLSIASQMPPAPPRNGNPDTRHSIPVGWALTSSTPPGYGGSRFSGRQRIQMAVVVCLACAFVLNVAGLMFGHHSPPPPPNSYDSQGDKIINAASELAVSMSSPRRKPWLVDPASRPLPTYPFWIFRRRTMRLICNPESLPVWAIFQSTCVQTQPPARQ